MSYMGINDDSLINDTVDPGCRYCASLLQKVKGLHEVEQMLAADLDKKNLQIRELEEDVLIEAKRAVLAERQVIELQEENASTAEVGAAIVNEQTKELRKQLEESNRLKSEAENTAIRLHQLWEKEPCSCVRKPLFAQCRRCRALEIFNEWDKEPSEKRNDLLTIPPTLTMDNVLKFVNGCQCSCHQYDGAKACGCCYQNKT